MRRVALLALFAVIGCASGSEVYTPGTTLYNAGKITVKEPELVNTPERQTDGLNIAGNNSTVKMSYWDAKLSTLGQVSTFEEFKKQYDTVRVNTRVEQGAADAILLDFRKWCSVRGVRTEFDRFWNPTSPPLASP